MSRFERNNGIIPNEYLDSTVAPHFDTRTLSFCDLDTDDKGNYYMQKGTLLAEYTSGTEDGKVGPYDTDGVTDGRQTAANIVGYLDSLVVTQPGFDKDVAVLYAGAVKADKVIVMGVQGDPGDTVKGYLQTTKLHILHR